MPFGLEDLEETFRKRGANKEENLKVKKQQAASGGGTSAASMQRVTVQMNYTQDTSKLQGFKQYMERDGVGDDGKKPELFTAQDHRGNELDPNTAAMPGEPRFYRVVISPENGEQITDMKQYVRDAMKGVELRTGQKLDWTAAIHHNTGHPHAHVLVRGLTKDGQETHFQQDFVKHGFRQLAQKTATLELGPRGKEEIERGRAAEAVADRYTMLDRQIAKLTPEAQRLTTKISRAQTEIGVNKDNLDKPGYSQELRDRLTQRNEALYKRVEKMREQQGQLSQQPTTVSPRTVAQRARLTYLSQIGLAEETKKGYQLTPGWDRALKQMQYRGEISKTMTRDLNVNKQLSVEPDKMHLYRSHQTINGTVVHRDMDERRQQAYAIIRDSTSGNYYYHRSNDLYRTREGQEVSLAKGKLTIPKEQQRSAEQDQATQRSPANADAGKADHQQKAARKGSRDRSEDMDLSR